MITQLTDANVDHGFRLLASALERHPLTRVDGTTSIGDAGEFMLMDQSHLVVHFAGEPPIVSATTQATSR